MIDDLSEKLKEEVVYTSKMDEHRIIQKPKLKYDAVFPNYNTRIVLKNSSSSNRDGHYIIVIECYEESNLNILNSKNYTDMRLLTWNSFPISLREDVDLKMKEIYPEIIKMLKWRSWLLSEKKS